MTILEVSIPTLAISQSKHPDRLHKIAEAHGLKRPALRYDETRNPLYQAILTVEGVTDAITDEIKEAMPARTRFRRLGA